MALHRLTILTTLLAFGAGACAASAAGSQQAPLEAAGAADPSRRALLIGINDYAAVPDLRGCVNDVQLTRRVLVERMGFEPARVRVLLDSEATREGILAALRTVVQETARGDTVVVWFSGHGSQADDVEREDGEDGLDETLVPQDGRQGDVPDILDDELGDILAPLAKLDVKAVIVLDSCHSGSGTRETRVLARGIERDGRRALYERVNRSRTRAGARADRRGALEVPELGHVLLAGADDHEEALDGPIAEDSGRYHGLFSYALVRAVQRLPVNQSLAALFEQVEAEYRTLGAHWSLDSLPNPQLEASPARMQQPLLEGAESNGVLLTKDAAGRLQLDANSLGAAVGALWQVFTAAGEPKGLATVVSHEGGRALLELADGTRLDDAARGIYVSPPRPPARIPVRIVGGPAEVAALASALAAACDDVAIVDSESFARLYLEVRGSRCEVRAADNRASIATLEGAPAVIAAEVARQLRKMKSGAEVASVDNLGSAIRLEVGLHQPGQSEPGRLQRSGKVVANVKSPVYRVRRPGEPRAADNSLMLEVRVDRECYVTAILIDSEGGATQVFPNEHSEAAGFYRDGRIPGGETLTIPDSLEDGNRAGFNVDIDEPVGQDSITVFASADLETAALIRQRLAPSVVEASTSPAWGPLRQALAARGGAVRPNRANAPLQPGDWTSRTVRYRSVR